MILDSTLLSLQAVLVGAITTSQPEVTVDYVLWNARGERTKPQTYRVALNSTTDVVILPAPTTPGFVHEPLRISIYNKDTASITVIVKTDDGTTERIENRKTLTTLTSYCWEQMQGWYTP